MEQVSGSVLDRLVLVVDQAERLYETADRAFYGQLKALTDLNKRVCWLLAAGPGWVQRIDPDNLLFAGRRLFVGPFTEQDFAAAVNEEGTKLGVGFNQDQQQQLYHLTGGHPGLLRSLSAAVVEESINLSLPLAELTEYLSGREGVQARCNRMWQVLSAGEQAWLDLCRQGRANKVPVESRKWLKNLGLLTSSSDELFSPLFAVFVKQIMQKAPQTAEAQAETRPRTDKRRGKTVSEQAVGGSLTPIAITGATTVSVEDQTIIIVGKVWKGDQETHVSPLELRLIACLKQSSRIFSYDEIANYVYYEAQGGIKPEQITSLVRQVRKRLGDKRYIKNHWGQGYELKDGTSEEI